MWGSTPRMATTKQKNKGTDSARTARTRRKDDMKTTTKTTSVMNNQTLPTPAMRKTILYVCALLAFASCTSNDFVGDQSLIEGNGEKAITFGFDVPMPTRASGAAAATALGNQFIVYGEKGETTKEKYADGKLVFPNYTVNYTTNTAYTTTSNTKDWEYVGIAPISTSNVKMYDGSTTTMVSSDAQTIKYWDYSAASYTFTAVSALSEDITNGRVVIQKNTTGTENVYQKGYTITLAKTAGSPDIYPTMNKLYFSDRTVIAQGTGTDRTATNAYGGNVTLTFRNLLSQVRAGVYETISGYDISDITFYVDNGSGEQTTLAQVSSTDAFGAKCPNLSTTNYEGTLTVTYYESGTVENQPKVTATGTSATNLILGTNISTISTSNLLGKAATNPTWDTSSGTYTEVFPQIDNTTSLKLKRNYTLWNSITQETINVTGATAEVPAAYLQWKPNYKYTYLFKISEDTNGSSGGSVTGLYPITFDAVEIVAEDGKAEYITTVSEPSITTFGVTAGKYVTDKDQYVAGSDVYATIMDGSSVVDFTLGTNVNVYKATTTDATNYPITEASVAESIAEISAGTKKITLTKINDDASTNFTAAPVKVTTVPGENGVDKTINALKLTGVKVTTATTALVVEYIKTAATYNTTGTTYADASAFAAAGTLYSDADGTTVASTWANASTTYYTRTSVKTVGTYAYKVINIVAAE